MVDCCSSSTMDESVLETVKNKRFGAQGWDALRESPFFEILWKNRNEFPQEVPSRLPADRDIRHQIDLEPGAKYCVSRCQKNKSITSMNFSTNEPRWDMCVRLIFRTVAVARPFVCVKPQIIGAWLMFKIS